MAETIRITIVGTLIMILAVFLAKAAVGQEARTVVISGAIDNGILRHADTLLELSTKQEPIHLLINSPGGSVYAGFQFLNAMQVAKNRGAEIHCTVTGIAMSMAFQILLHCDKRAALQYSLLMFHPPRVFDPPLLTPDKSQNLAYDLKRIDQIIWAQVQRAFPRMSRQHLRYLYINETVLTAEELLGMSPGWLTIVGDIPTNSVWR